MHGEVYIQLLLSQYAIRILVDIFLLQDMFYSVETVLKRFLDVDHLLSLWVQIPKHDNIKAAESKITKVIVYCNTAW